MKTGIPNAQAIVKRIKILHRLEFPRHLMNEQPNRTGKEFDPNSYFALLTHLTLIPGYTLDYYYHFTMNLGGIPCLYARPIYGRQEYKVQGHESRPPAHFIGPVPVGSLITSYEDYLNWQKKNVLSDFIIADGTPESFFELVVFRCMAGKFYLQRYADHDDLKIIAGPSDVEDLISEINDNLFGDEEFTYEQIAQIRNIETMPVVDFEDSDVSITYCTFTKWDGFLRIREHFRRTPPHIYKGRETFDQVEYECSVML